MAKKGKRLTFHGAFGTKAKAVHKEKAGKNRFILTRTIRGDKRFIVVSGKRGG